MNDIISTIWGGNTNLTATQMSMRAIIIFFICFLLLRISGRRSFGLKTPFDNVIAIILGSLISRTIVGASPFLPTIISSVCLVLLHRILGMGRVSNFNNNKHLEGQPILLFSEGKFIELNLKRAMVSKMDINAALRQILNQEHLLNIDKIFMENNGHISFVKKNE